MTTSLFYPLTQFKDWIDSNATSYVLTDEVLHVVSYLEKTIEIPDMVPMSGNASMQRGPNASSSHHFSHKTSFGGGNGSGGGGPSRASYDSRNRSSDPMRKPRSSNNDRDRDRHPSNRNSKPAPTMEDWEMTRNFKTTKFETKTGVEKQINDIRIVLNKISSANYDKQRDAILGHIREFFSYECEDPLEREENIKKISYSIFDIASSNKFYSELYAQLYKELISEFEIFGTIIDSFIAGFNETIATIQYVDPDDNYDEFCRINKINDKRKATAAFIVNLMKKSVIPIDTITDIIHVFMQHILSDIKEPNKGKEVEEITETLFILITNCKTDLLTHTRWIEDIYPHIKVLSSTNAKQNNPSISNRVIFKFMDLV
jgi:hypothetical protein